MSHLWKWFDRWLEADGGPIDLIERRAFILGLKEAVLPLLSTALLELLFLAVDSDRMYRHTHTLAAAATAIVHTPIPSHAPPSRQQEMASLTNTSLWRDSRGTEAKGGLEAA